MVMQVPRIALGLSAAALMAIGTGMATAEPSAVTREFSAQSRPHIVIRPRHDVPGPDAKRYCHSWLAREDRPSGPVIVPQMRCWWR